MYWSIESRIFVAIPVEIMKNKNCLPYVNKALDYTHLCVLINDRISFSKVSTVPLSNLKNRIG